MKFPAELKARSAICMLLPCLHIYSRSPRRGGREKGVGKRQNHPLIREQKLPLAVGAGAPRYDIRLGRPRKESYTHSAAGFVFSRGNFDRGLQAELASRPTCVLIKFISFNFTPTDIDFTVIFKTEAAFQTISTLVW